MTFTDGFAAAVIMNLLTSAVLAGAGWHVRIAHLPVLRRAGRARFPAVSRPADVLHAAVMTPLMVFETLLAIALLGWLSAAPLWWIPVAAAAVAVCNLALQLTAARARWRALTAGFDPRAYRVLLRFTMLQALLWSARVILLTMMLVPLLP